MYTKQSLANATDGYEDLSYRDLEMWQRVREGGSSSTVVRLGDETNGPLLFLSALPPGKVTPLSPAHAHASDTFRISLLGELTMGRERYGSGEFRFQEGWKVYPSDNSPQGPDGGWGMVLFANFRGGHMRLAKETKEMLERITADEGKVAALLGITTGDLASADPLDTAGPSALVTTVGAAAVNGKLNGSFVTQGAWPAVSPDTHAVVGLLGEPSCGPVVVLASTEPGKVAAVRSCFDTEVFRAVVSGSCDIDGRHYEKGDMRVQRAGVWSGPVIAGLDGLQELFILGDRRHAACLVEQEGAWPSSLGVVVNNLLDELSSKTPA